MRVSSKSFDNKMRDVLRHFLDGSVNIDFENDDDAMECMEECIKLEYLIGIDTIRNASGNLCAQTINPKVTRKGLYFLESKDPDLRSRQALVVSIIAILISILSLINELVGSFISPVK